MRISIAFPLFSAYYPLLFQHYFPLCIAFPYAFPMIVKPPSHIRMIKNLNPLQQPKKWNLSTMLTATKEVKPLHFVWWWLSFYCIFYYILVLILSKINDMGPYGILLTKCHLISRHHGEIYTTRSVQSDRTSNALCRFSHFGIHVPLNFYNFNPNFSLPVLLKV